MVFASTSLRLQTIWRVFSVAATTRVFRRRAVFQYWCVGRLLVFHREESTLFFHSAIAETIEGSHLEMQGGHHRRW